jgi:hypothetical protein
MLFLIPQFKSESHFEDVASSPAYMLDSLSNQWSRYSAACDAHCGTSPSCTPTSNPGVKARKRLVEADLLSLVHWHNWYSATSCSSDVTCYGDTYRSAVLWLGLRIDQPPANPACAGLPSLALSELYTAQDNAKYSDLTARYSSAAYSLSPGPVPQGVLDGMTKAWGEYCEIKELSTGSDVVKVWGYALTPEVKCPSDIRWTERHIYAPSKFSSGSGFVVFFDKRNFTQKEAVNNILQVGPTLPTLPLPLQTLFVCVMLGLGAMLFSNDATELALRPIERMVEKMRKIKVDPLYAARLGDDDFAEQDKKRRMDEEKLRKRQIMLENYDKADALTKLGVFWLKSLALPPLPQGAADHPLLVSQRVQSS